MTFLSAVLLIAIGVLFVWRVVALARKYDPLAEAEPTAPAGDLGVREPRPKRPPSLAGAVALEETDDE